MITFLFLFLFTVLIILLVRGIISKRKKKFPELSDIQNENEVSGITHSLLIVWIIGCVFGVGYINLIYKTKSEKKEIEAKKIIVQNEVENRKKIAAEIYARKNRPINEKVNEGYFLLKQNSSVNEKFKIFDDLLDEAKGGKEEKKVKKTRDSLLTVININDEKEASLLRKKYGEDFRNLLLDKGLNIKVLVYGKNNKKMKLTYPLFDEVWFHRFKKEGYFDMIHDRGFTDIELTDGYRYGEGIRYDN